MPLPHSTSTNEDAQRSGATDSTERHEDDTAAHSTSHHSTSAADVALRATGFGGSVVSDTDAAAGSGLRPEASGLFAAVRAPPHEAHTTIGGRIAANPPRHPDTGAVLPYYTRTVAGGFSRDWPSAPYPRGVNAMKLFIPHEPPPFPTPAEAQAKVPSVDAVDMDALRAPPCGPAHIQATWLGHACYLVQVGGVNILTDPVWSQRASPFKHMGAKRFKDPPVPLVSDLPRIDVVTISHNHYDHLDYRTVRALRKAFQPTFVVPLGLKDWFRSTFKWRPTAVERRRGIKHPIEATVHEMDWWAATAVSARTDDDYVYRRPKETRRAERHEKRKVRRQHRRDARAAFLARLKEGVASIREAVRGTKSDRTGDSDDDNDHADAQHDGVSAGEMRELERSLALERESADVSAGETSTSSTDSSSSSDSDADDDDAPARDDAVDHETPTGEHAADGVVVTFVPVHHWTMRSGPWDRNQQLWGGFVFEVDVTRHCGDDERHAVTRSADYTPDVPELLAQPAADDAAASHSDERTAMHGDGAPTSQRVIRRVFHSGDTGYQAMLFKMIGDVFRRFDLALIGIGCYSPKRFMHAQHVDPEEAVKIHCDLRRPHQTLAMHWGTWILTDEPIDEPPRLLAEARLEYGIPDEEFVALKHGETRRVVITAASDEPAK